MLNTSRKLTGLLISLLSCMFALSAVMPAVAAAHPQAKHAKHHARRHHRRRNHHHPRHGDAAVNMNVGVILTTADMSQALALQPALQWQRPAPSGLGIVAVNGAERYQTFKGVGAAITDTSAWLIHDQLSPGARSVLMDSLYGSGGLHLSFLRVPIAASDFTVGETPYSYDDLPAGQTDRKLKHFSIAHDRAYILPTLREALKLNPSAFVLADPWSPPGWMKSNDDLSNSGGAELNADAYTPLARYFTKFLLAYAQAGVPVSAIIPQNEPGNATIYPGMDMTEGNEATFIQHYLEPALRRAGLSTSIYGYDYGWDAKSIPFAFQLAASSTARDLTGIATHCYYGSPTEMSALHAANPSLDEIVSECAPGITPFSTSELEVLATRNWASAVALWNLALDPNGGPVQPPNHGCPSCTGVVTVNPRTHSFARTIDYYELGQLSRFVQPGAVRIGSNNFVSYLYPGPGHNVASAGLDDVAFQNPDGSDALIAYDNSSAPIRFGVRSSHGRYFSYRLPAGATVTFIWDHRA